MTKDQTSKMPKPGDVWSVRHLWTDKAHFFKAGECDKAARLPRTLHGTPDGYACVPFKSRPAVVIAAGDHSGESFLVCFCSSKPPQPCDRVKKFRIGRIGNLGDDSYVRREAPSLYHRALFSEFHDVVDREFLGNLLKIIGRFGLSGDEPPVATTDKHGDGKSFDHDASVD